MSAIEINGHRKNEPADCRATNASGIEPTRRRSPADAVTAEKFSNAVNRRNPLSADADLREDRLFDLLAQLQGPDGGVQTQAQSVSDATALPAPALPAEATSVLLAAVESALARTTRDRHTPVQGRPSGDGLQAVALLRVEQNINRTAGAADDDQASDALQAIAQPTPQTPAAADSNVTQPAHVDMGMTERRMLEFQQLICQMGAQVGIDGRRSEIAISLSHAMFSSTRLKIRADKDSIQVDYECGTAEEADWFGSNAEALVQRLSITLQRHVTIRPVADHLDA